jgi:hypothetical protein
MIYTEIKDNPTKYEVYTQHCMYAHHYMKGWVVVDGYPHYKIVKPDD